MFRSFVSLLIPVLIMFNVGCATVHQNNFAVHSEGTEVANTSLKISCAENWKLSTDYFGVIDFTFENTTNKFITIDRIDIDFGDDSLDQTIKIPVGYDLRSWAVCIKQKKAIESYNTELFLGALTVAGGVIGSVDNSRNLDNLGHAAAFGGLTLLTAKGISDMLDQVQNPNIVPESHLLSGGIVIPPGLFQKKWILLYTENPLELPFIDTIYLTYTLSDGNQEKVKMRFRNKSACLSSWQKVIVTPDADYRINVTQ